MNRLVSILLLMATACAPGAGGPRPDDAITTRSTFEGLEVNNSSGQSYTDCEFILNGDYELGGRFEVDATQVTLPWTGFSNDAGERFDWPALALKTVRIHCREPRTLSYYGEF